MRRETEDALIGTKQRSEKTGKLSSLTAAKSKAARKTVTSKKDSDSEGKIRDTVIGTALSHTARTNYVPALVMPLQYTREVRQNWPGWKAS